MIQPEELRIGNVIFINDSLRTVEGIVGDQVWYKREGFLVQDTCSSSRPIPLTEEWLKRAGFERNSDGTFVLIHIMYALPEMGVMQLAIGYSPLINCPCKYVHQLQNLYYALTGTELTIKG